MNDGKYLHALPKIDLHHHFDGAFELRHLYQEARRRNLPQGRLSEAEFNAQCQVSAECRTLTEFLAVFEFFYEIAQDADFLSEEARRLPARMAAQGVIYLETRFGPHLFTGPGLTPERVTEAVVSGLESGSRAQNTTLPPVRLILCAMRNAPVDQVAELLSLYEKFHGRGVCGLDLAGDESRYACREYAPVFARAREMGIPVTIHAGEAAGHQSVLDALDLFGARRIGHGIRAVESPALIERLVRERITLEVCLTSNLQTGNAPGYAQHPFERLRAAGVRVTINTDDPSVSGIDLAHEWQQAITTYSLAPQDQRQLLLNSAEAAFCSAAERDELKKRIESFFASQPQ
ncbi:MAG: adenosine deaminase [Spirochaetota bacterium]